MLNYQTSKLHLARLFPQVNINVLIDKLETIKDNESGSIDLGYMQLNITKDAESTITITYSGPALYTPRGSVLTKVELTKCFNCDPFAETHPDFDYVYQVSTHATGPVDNTYEVTHYFASGRLSTQVFNADNTGLTSTTIPCYVLYEVTGYVRLARYFDRVERFDDWGKPEYNQN